VDVLYNKLYSVRKFATNGESPANQIYNKSTKNRQPTYSIFQDAVQLVVELQEIEVMEFVSYIQSSEFRRSFQLTNGVI